MLDNETAFNEIYRTFHHRIHRYLWRRVGEADAEDLTQTVFLKVNRALHDFRGDSSLATWIYRIAANAATDHARSLATRNACSYDDAARTATSETGSVWTGEMHPAIDHALARKQMNECIRGIVEKLPGQSRAVITLSEYEGLKDAEIAEALGTSLATVKIRLHRARLRLRSDLTSRCHLYRDERNELACDPKHCP